MKVALVAFTNLTLQNAVAIKMSYFPNEDCDLIVAHTSSISSLLLSAIASSQLMAHLYTISNADMESGMPKKGSLKKAFFFWKEHKKGFRIIRRAIDALQPPAYDLILTPYLSNNLLPILNALIQKNRKTHIQFYEEGTFVYGRGIRALTNTVFPVREAFRKQILRNAFEYPYLRKLRKHVEKTLYLRLSNYAFESQKGFTIKQIPSFAECDPENLLFGKLALSLDNELLDRYRSAPAVYITQALYNEKNSLISRYHQALRTCLAFLGTGNLLIKMHPTAAYSSQNDYRNLDNYTFVDRMNPYPLEAIFRQMKDMDHQVLISSMSAAMFHPKLMFDQEPYLIFLFPMFEADSLDIYTDMEKLVSALKETYRESSKVICVRNLFELRGALYEIEKREKTSLNSEPYMMTTHNQAVSHIPLEQYKMEDALNNIVNQQLPLDVTTHAENGQNIQNDSASKLMDNLLSGLQITIQSSPSNNGFSIHMEGSRQDMLKEHSNIRVGEESHETETKPERTIQSVTEYWQLHDILLQLQQLEEVIESSS